MQTRIISLVSTASRHTSLASGHCRSAMRQLRTTAENPLPYVRHRTHICAQYRARSCYGSDNIVASPVHPRLYDTLSASRQIVRSGIRTNETSHRIPARKPRYALPSALPVSVCVFVCALNRASLSLKNEGSHKYHFTGSSW